MTLTREEVRLFKELSESERSISGNQSHAGTPKRLIEAGYVVDEPVTRGDPSIIKDRITDAGREALKEAEI